MQVGIDLEAAGLAQGVVCDPCIPGGPLIMVCVVLSWLAGCHSKWAQASRDLPRQCVQRGHWLKAARLSAPRLTRDLWRLSCPTTDLPCSSFAGRRSCGACGAYLGACQPAQPGGAVALRQRGCSGQLSSRLGRRLGLQAGACSAQMGRWAGAAGTREVSCSCLQAVFTAPAKRVAVASEAAPCTVQQRELVS